MPGRDYTKAYNYLQQSLEDSYLARPHVDRFHGLTGLQALPGDLWRQSLIEHEDDVKIDFTKSHDSSLTVALDGRNVEGYFDCAQTATTTRPLRATRSNTPAEALQLPTPVSTPNSSQDRFAARNDDSMLSSLYTESFQTARENNYTPIPLRQRRKLYPSLPTNDEDDTSERLYDSDNRSENVFENVLSKTISPSSVSTVTTRIPQHVKVDSGGMKSLKADIQDPDESQNEENDEEESNSTPIRGLNMSNVNAREDESLIPQASVHSLLRTPEYSQLDLPTVPDLDGKRPSLTSDTAAGIVEALLVDHTPPRRKRKLRHVGKDTDLRDAASQTESNRTSFSEASVLVTKPPQDRRLSSLLRTVSSLESDRSGSGSSRRLRHTGKLNSPKTPQLYSFFDEEEPAHVSQGVEGHQQHLAGTVLPAIDVPLKSVEASLPPSTTPRLRRKSSTITEAVRKASAASARNIDPADSPTHTRKPSEASGLFGLGISSRPSHQPDYPSPVRRGTDNSIAFSHSRKASDDRSVRRASLTPRYLHHRTLSSPTSFNSEGCYTPQLDEATAINLYPHHNTSLLVVQQQAISEPPELAPLLPPMMTEHDHLSRPTIEIDVPVTDFNDGEYPSISHDESGTRGCPNPPIFTLIPPTPGGEMPLTMLDADVDRNHATQATDAPPKRQSTVFQRAREYSDNMFQPFFTLKLSSGGSLHRNLSRRSNYYSSKRISAPQPIDDATEREKDEKLHPFWQPRDFWDGINDGDDEQGDNNTDARGDNHDNAHTTPHDYEEQSAVPAIQWRRGGSLRFLIGNTLGIDRQPTNRRLQVVQWPSNKKRRIDVVADDPTAAKDGRRASYFERKTLRDTRNGTLLERVRDRLVGRKSSIRSRRKSRRWRENGCGMGGS